MLGMVMKAGCVKAQMKMGFINDKTILQLFEESEPGDDMKALQIVEWIQNINDVIEKNTIKIEFD